MTRIVPRLTSMTLDMNMSMGIITQVYKLKSMNNSFFSLCYDQTFINISYDNFQKNKYNSTDERLGCLLEKFKKNKNFSEIVFYRRVEVTCLSGYGAVFLLCPGQVEFKAYGRGNYRTPLFST